MRVVDIIDSIQRMNGAFIPQHADIVQQRGAKNGLLPFVRQFQPLRQRQGDLGRSLHMPVQFRVNDLDDSGGQHQGRLQGNTHLCSPFA